MKRSLISEWFEVPHQTCIIRHPAAERRRVEKCAVVTHFVNNTLHVIKKQKGCLAYISWHQLGLHVHTVSMVDVKNLASPVDYSVTTCSTVEERGFIVISGRYLFSLALSLLSFALLWSDLILPWMLSRKLQSHCNEVWLIGHVPLCEHSLFSYSGILKPGKLDRT